MEAIVRPEEVPWNDEAAALLRGAVGGEPTYSITDLRDEVNAGKAQLFRWWANEAILGYTVLWIDASFGDREMVIQAGAALKNNRRSFGLVYPVIEDMARAQGCSHIRSHLTDGKWMGAFKAHRFYRSEVVMRKRL